MIHATEYTLLIFAAVGCVTIGRPLLGSCIGILGIAITLLR